jgi:hypothetical protein
MTIAESKPIRINHAGFAFLLMITIFAVFGVGVATALYAQDNWRPILAVCLGASGAGTAEDNLLRLKALNAATDEVKSAISRCEAKANALRQPEQQIWMKALEAKKNWDCSDSRRQFKILGDKASLYQSQASAEAKKLGDCGERIITQEMPEVLLQHAQTDYNGRDFPAAREKAWHIVGLKNSVGEQAQQLLKNIDEIEAVNDSLRRADRAFRAKKVHDACSILLRVEESHPTFPNMAEIKTKLNDCPTTPTQVGSLPAPKTDLEKQLQAVKLYLDEGNIELANERLTAATKLAPKDKAVSQLQQALQAAKQARDLLDHGVSLIYEAKYSEAEDQLAHVATGQTSPGLVARAHFYIGVAMAHEFYLGGNGTLKDKAVQEFQTSAPDFMKPDFDQISPKIKQLYDEAIGN